jgi:hypothetical protein
LIAISQSAPSERRMIREANDDTVLVRKCEDFTVTGKGDNQEWNNVKWNLMTKLDTGGKEYVSRFKILYSSTGIYLLFNGEDEKLATREDQDFGRIYEGDAFEVFFHPDPGTPVYFEYEINALNKELILVISRIKNRGYSWVPWQYENKREQNKKVDLGGREMKPGGLLKSWSAEIFFPYELLDLLPGGRPQSGSVWNANFCRLDYDTENMIKWSWSPGIIKSFHELEKFRSIVFE